MQQQNFSLYGAVDLGARKAAAQRQQASAATTDAPTAASAYVFDVAEATFEADVLERSRTVPIVMDLWAQWCEPCKQLTPVLEKLAAEAAGAWLLGRVDVDANPQLSAALGVQSIPMVVGVIGGQLVPGFLGALPESQVRQWLGQLTQVAQQLGVTSDGIPPEQDGSDSQPNADEGEPGSPAAYQDPGLVEAQQAMERGDLDGAAAAFERVLSASPGHPVAALGLARVNLFRRVSEVDPQQARREAAAHPDNVAAQCRVADIDLADGQADEAFDRLLGVIRRTSGDDKDAARLHLVQLFDIFPPGDPRVAKARAALSSLLF